MKDILDGKRPLFNVKYYWFNKDEITENLGMEYSDLPGVIYNLLESFTIETGCVKTYESEELAFSAFFDAIKRYNE